MQNLFNYKTMPVWNNQTLPGAFKQKHNTKPGTWAQLTLFTGELTYALLTESGETLQTFHCNVDQQPPLIEPQQWHKIVNCSDDMTCQLVFYCQAEQYYSNKYELTHAHSEVINAAKIIPPGNALDLGCGGGRNALYLNLKGFNVTAWDKNSLSIENLNQIIHKEQLSHITATTYDLNNQPFTGEYDFVLSTVVLMFLEPRVIPRLIENIQSSTHAGGYNLIVAAIDSKDYPCQQVPFTFAFKPDELAHYYQGWQLIKYNEDVGELHRTDANGNRIKLRFATLLAKKPLD